MKVVTGLWPPTAGTVMVSGREVAGPLSIAGMAFQNPTLLPWRTTLDNVMLPLEIVEPHARGSSANAPPTRPRRAISWPSSASRGSRTIFPGSCRAGCSSAPRSAGR